MRTSLRNLLKNKGAYSLIELLITIGILTIILTLTAILLTTTVKASLRVELRSTVRQEVELALEIMRRDLRSAIPEAAGVQLTCEPLSMRPGADAELLIPFADDTVLVFKVGDSDGSGVLQVSNDGGINFYDVTSPEVHITGIDIVCSPLASGNYTYIITIMAESRLLRKDGEPMVSGIAKQTSVTVRSRGGV